MEQVTERDPLRVVVAEDSVLVREGVTSIHTQTGFDVVGRAGDVRQPMRSVREQAPDVAIIDIRMPPTQTDEGLQAAVFDDDAELSRVPVPAQRGRHSAVFSVCQLVRL